MEENPSRIFIPCLRPYRERGVKRGRAVSALPGSVKCFSFQVGVIFSDNDTLFMP